MKITFVLILGVLSTVLFGCATGKLWEKGIQTKTVRSLDDVSANLRISPDKKYLMFVYNDEERKQRCLKYEPESKILKALDNFVNGPLKPKVTEIKALSYSYKDSEVSSPTQQSLFAVNFAPPKEGTKITTSKAPVPPANKRGYPFKPLLLYQIAENEYHLMTGHKPWRMYIVDSSRNDNYDINAWNEIKYVIYDEKDNFERNLSLLYDVNKFVNSGVFDLEKLFQLDNSDDASHAMLNDHNIVSLGTEDLNCAEALKWQPFSQIRKYTTTVTIQDHVLYYGYNLPLPILIFVTPASIAFDVATFPFQLFFVTNFKP